jgi:cytidine deaminase
LPVSDALIEAARRARAHAIAPYSSFRVGAALQAADGRIITGCNIENASYGLTMCAERVALFKALSDGITSFVAVAVVADTPHPTPPCGACRQLIWEFCGQVPVALANLERVTSEHTSGGLLPSPFDGRTLGAGAVPS